VAQFGVENNCVVTCVVSCTTNGNLIPFQVVYKGQTNRSLPGSPKAKMVVDHNGFTLALFDNHW
jgi:hypothetical protein